MTVGQQILLFIIKREPISLIFKDIFCFQNSSKYSFPILQIFDGPGSVSYFQSNQSPILIKHPY